MNLACGDGHGREGGGGGRDTTIKTFHLGLAQPLFSHTNGRRGHGERLIERLLYAMDLFLANCRATSKCRPLRLRTYTGTRMGCASLQNLSTFVPGGMHQPLQEKKNAAVAALWYSIGYRFRTNV